MVRSAIPAMMPAAVFAFVPSARAEYEEGPRARDTGRPGDAPVERRAGAGAGDPRG